MPLSYLNATVHRALQSALFVPLTFDDAGVGTVDAGGMLVFVSDEWSWPLRRIVGEELTEEERKIPQKGGGGGEKESGRRETGE